MVCIIIKLALLEIIDNREEIRENREKIRDEIKEKYMR